MTVIVPDLNEANFLVFGVANMFRYRNHRGEVVDRRFVPHCLRFGRTLHHPEDQWLLEVYDCDRDAPRTYALNDIIPR